MLFCRHGLPEPEINVAVMSGTGSQFLCRGDFVWRDTKVIGEYQGSHHFDGFTRTDHTNRRDVGPCSSGWAHTSTCC